MLPLMAPPAFAMRAALLPPPCLVPSAEAGAQQRCFCRDAVAATAASPLMPDYRAIDIAAPLRPINIQR